MLYKSDVWSRNGNQIAYVRYFIIDADRDTIEQIKRETNPKNVDEFMSHLVIHRKINVEEVMPISLDM